MRYDAAGGGNTAASADLMPRAIPIPEGTEIAGAPSSAAAINHGDSNYFTQTDYFTLESNSHPTMLKNHPTYQQTTEETCGPAAALTVLWYLGDRDQTEASLTTGMKTQPYPIGTNPQDMVDFFKSQGWRTGSSLDGGSFQDYEKFASFVIENLKGKTPVMLENVDWGGHWRVIIGYDTMGTDSSVDDILIFADPYDTCNHKQDGYAVQSGEKFFSMWFDHSMLPESQRQQPWITIKR